MEREFRNAMNASDANLPRLMEAFRELGLKTRIEDPSAYEQFGELDLAGGKKFSFLSEMGVVTGMVMEPRDAGPASSGRYVEGIHADFAPGQDPMEAASRMLNELDDKGYKPERSVRPDLSEASMPAARPAPGQVPGVSGPGSL